MPIWPGSIGFASCWLVKMPIAVINFSSKRPDSHFGTHLDAPLHFVENGKAVHQLELEQLIGEAHVAEVR